MSFSFGFGVFDIWLFCDLCLLFSLHIYRYTHVCLVPRGIRRYQMPWNWDYRWLWAVTWVLGAKSLEE